MNAPDFYPINEEMFWSLYRKLRANRDLANKLTFTEAVEILDVCSTVSVAAKRVYDAFVKEARPAPAEQEGGEG